MGATPLDGGNDPSDPQAIPSWNVFLQNSYFYSWFGFWVSMLGPLANKDVIDFSAQDAIDKQDDVLINLLGVPLDFSILPAGMQVLEQLNDMAYTVVLDNVIYFWNHENSIFGNGSFSIRQLAAWSTLSAQNQATLISQFGGDPLNLGNLLGFDQLGAAEQTLIFDISFQHGSLYAPGFDWYGYIPQIFQLAIETQHWGFAQYIMSLINANLATYDPAEVQSRSTITDRGGESTVANRPRE